MQLLEYDIFVGIYRLYIVLGLKCYFLAKALMCSVRSLFFRTKRVQGHFRVMTVLLRL